MWPLPVVAIASAPSSICDGPGFEPRLGRSSQSRQGLKRRRSGRHHGHQAPSSEAEIIASILGELQLLRGFDRQQPDLFKLILVDENRLPHCRGGALLVTLGGRIACHQIHASSPCPDRPPHAVIGISASQCGFARRVQAGVRPRALAGSAGGHTSRRRGISEHFKAIRSRQTPRATASCAKRRRNNATPWSLR